MPITPRPRGFQRSGKEIDDGAHPGQHSSTRREDEVEDSIDAAPIRKYARERARGEVLLTVRRRHHRDAYVLARRGDQNFDAPRREQRFERDCLRLAVLGGEAPGAGAFRILMEDGKIDQIGWGRRHLL